MTQKNVLKLFSSTLLAFLFFINLSNTIIAQHLNHNSENKFLKVLIDGNERFVSNNLSSKDYKKELQEVIKGQHPYAIIVSCSDSRVPPEIIFDESIGKLFIIRVAGNVIDPVTLGSIEYAAEHLHAPLLMVLGHESCGAVNATIAGGETTPNIEEIIKRIEPSVEKAKHFKEHSHLSDLSIEQNVKDQISYCLKDSPLLKELVHKNELTIVGAVFSISTGKVTLIEE